ncbi:hypothetical protein BHU72_08230 [Desulfuribacillus stibiiarsenatis]|uniref:ATP-grasp domain-containing protein n=1 Tax=Desulfuribacillus stibiiarsenatis TaxID=1390249 RepID=A0A1E5L3Y6_9FIRM|nr:YheC/YheD family protein [Desulfuribacillus stibiiarsenatis]OEH84811.1 hypothetical protein BHU72_08230 [Desulfuribacillus stibiiarsenatis]
MGSFCKWEIYNILNKDSRINMFLPEATLLTNVELAFDYLHCYKSIFIKPCVPHVGFHVIHIVRIKRDVYHYHYYCNGQICTSTVGYIEIETMLLKQMKFTKCFVQRGIKVTSYKGSLIDLNVKVGRKLDGSWKQHGIYAKLAAAKSTITSQRFGGKVSSLDEITNLSGLSKSVFQSEILEYSSTIVNILDPKLKNVNTGSWLGYEVDFAIDTVGRIWSLGTNPMNMHYGNALELGLDIYKEIKKIKK